MTQQWLQQLATDATDVTDGRTSSAKASEQDQGESQRMALLAACAAARQKSGAVSTHGRQCHRLPKELLRSRELWRPKAMCAR